MQCLSSVSCLLGVQRQDAAGGVKVRSTGKSGCFFRWSFRNNSHVCVMVSHTHTGCASRSGKVKSTRINDQRNSMSVVRFIERVERERKYLHVTTRVTVAFNDDCS